MSLNIKIEVTNEATPVLVQLHRELTDRTELNNYIGASAAAGTRMYIRAQAAVNHKTSTKLGASPTNYLAKRAEMVSHETTPDGTVLSVTGAIFKRVFGPVTVRPREKKMLTIPWAAEAYGKRAHELGSFDGPALNKLFIYVSKRGQAFIARREGRTMKLLYLLKSFVVLSQDRELLPDAEAFGEWAELAGRSYFKKWLREAEV